MLNRRVKSPVPDLLFINTLFLSLSAVTLGLTDGVTVVALEGDDSILPCSLSSKNIIQNVFDWKRDGQKEVFLYAEGRYYNNGRVGQDEQFQGRVSHFPEQLKFGNASITIRNTKLTDSGNYSCIFPKLQPPQIFYIHLVVEQTLRDRSQETFGAAPKPDVRILNVSEDGVLLQCKVPGASPLPTVQWKDSDGNILPAEEPQVTHRVDRYYVTLLTTVTKTKTNRFYCVVTQEEIAHVTEDDVFVPFCVKTVQYKSDQVTLAWIGGWFLGFLSFAGLFVIAKWIRKHHIRGLNRRSSCNGAAELPQKNNLELFVSV